MRLHRRTDNVLFLAEDVTEAHDARGECRRCPALCTRAAHLLSYPILTTGPIRPPPPNLASANAVAAAPASAAPRAVCVAGADLVLCLARLSGGNGVRIDVMRWSV